MLNTSFDSIKQTLIKRFRRLPPDGDALVCACPESPVFADFPELMESGFPENPPALNPFKSHYMKRFRFIPLDDSEGKVLVAMADPLDFITREVIERAYDKALNIRKSSEETISQFVYR
ncbi:MAG: hypothetical protein J0651_00800 [Actinobacteria bacterium]|nr:hypothetical protein [Actinomycetota bacterium]